MSLKSLTTLLLVVLVGVTLSACGKLHLTTNKERVAKFIDHPSYDQDCVKSIMTPASDKANYRRASKARRILDRANKKIAKECEVKQKGW